MIGTRRAEDGRLAQVLAGRDAAHRESVIAHRARAPPERTGPRRPRGQAPRDLARRPAGDPRLRADGGARPAHGRAGAAGVGRLLPAGGRRDGRLHRLAAAAELRAARVPRVPAGRRTRRPHDPGGPGLRARDPCPTSRRARSPTRRRWTPSTPRSVAGSRKASSSSSRRRRPTRRCTGARGWTTSGCGSCRPEGEIVGEARLVGLFTSKAYMEPAAKTPLLHHKLEQIITAEDLIPGSHDYKEVVELFESFPRDELFQASGRGAPPARRRPAAAREARRDPRPGAQGSLRAPGLDRRRVAAREVQRGRSASACRRCSCERFHGTSVDYHLSLGETESARIFFTVHVEPGMQIPEIPYEELEAEVEQLARTWDDDLLDQPDRGLRPRARARRSPPSTDRGSPTTTRWSRPTGNRWASTSHAGAPEDRGRRLRDRDLQRGDRRAPHAGQALQDRRQGRPVRVHAAPRVARSAGRRRGARSPSRARARSTSTTSACSTRAAPC